MDLLKSVKQISVMLYNNNVLIIVSYKLNYMDCFECYTNDFCINNPHSRCKLTAIYNQHFRELDFHKIKLIEAYLPECVKACDKVIHAVDSKK